MKSHAALSVVVLFATVVSAQIPTWNVDADGLYFNPANWTDNQVPSGVTETARFGDIITQPRTVTLDDSAVLNKLVFDSAVAYTIDGSPSTLTLGGADHELNAVQGSHDIQATVIGSAGIAKTGAGSVSIRKLTAAGDLAVNAGTLSLSGGSTVASKIRGISIADGAQLTVGQTPVIFTPTSMATTLETLRLLLRDGKIGIGSPSNHAIGFMDPPAPQTVGGETVNPGQILLRQTRPGDAFLDLTVNFDDLLVVAKLYGRTDTTWRTGDFNYDGATNFADLLILAQNYGGSALSADDLAAFDEQFASDWSLALSMVPEPMTLGWILAAGVMARRTRK